MRKFLFLFLLSNAILMGFSVIPGMAAPMAEKWQLKTDSSWVLQRNFDAQQLKAYSKTPEFIYKETAPVDLSLWSRFWTWFWEQISSVLKHKTSGGLIKFAVIAILVGVICFLVIKFIGVDFKIFTGKSKGIDVPYTETMENIHEINFNEEIEKAISEGNFRLAVRLFYLRSLKVLNDRELIHWQPEKTNQTYVDELKDPEQQQQFSALTRNFEYIWYGEFFIDKAHFNEVKQDFDQFNRRRS